MISGLDTFENGTNTRCSVTKKSWEYSFSSGVSKYYSTFRTVPAPFADMRSEKLEHLAATSHVVSLTQDSLPFCSTLHQSGRRTSDLDHQKLESSSILTGAEPTVPAWASLLLPLLEWRIVLGLYWLPPPEQSHNHKDVSTTSYKRVNRLVKHKNLFSILCASSSCYVSSLIFQCESILICLQGFYKILQNKFDCDIDLSQYLS